MPQIPLNNGKVAWISPEDAEFVKQFKWRYAPNSGYCVHYYKELDKNKTMFLHRAIYSRVLGHPIPRGYFIDHLNGDRLDARRENLRLATPNQNAWNQVQPISSTSPLKGVRSKGDKFEASIRYFYQGIYLGRFDNLEMAGLMYDAAARTLFGDFAKLNFPDKAIPTTISERLQKILASKDLQPRP